MNNLNRKVDIEKAALYLLFKSYIQEEGATASVNFVDWMDKNGLFLDLPPLHALDKLWRKHDVE